LALEPEFWKSLAKGSPVVIKLSGSLYFSSRLRELANSLVSVLKKDSRLKLILIAGGGKNAREYISEARKFGADQATLDEIGIGISRLNAMVSIEALKGKAIHRVPETLSEVVNAFETMGTKSVIVVGGLHPGQSTNAVAALIAEKLGASLLINATDVEGVYSKDPQRHRDAVLLKTTTPEELGKILKDESMAAGGYDLMDPVAIKLVKRSKIPTLIMKCEGAKIADVLAGKRSYGTRLVFGN
jgi:uridylate kinase